MSSTEREPSASHASSAREELRRAFYDWPDAPDNWDQRPGFALDAPSDRQLDLLVQVLDLYRQRGVVESVTGLAPPVACANRCVCWAGRPPAAYKDHPAISLPYIGPAYEPRGVAMLGMNLREAGGLLEEFQISALNLKDLAKGNRRSLSSVFAYHSAQSARALIQSRAGVPVVDYVNPEELGDFVLATARLQSVKCGPADRRRTTPYPQMYKPCREMYLLDELDILQPGALLAFGVDVSGNVLWPLCRGTLIDKGGGVEQGTITRDWGVIDVYRIYHPSMPRWSRSHNRLLELLRR
jgi:hypothetical protein